MDFIALVELRAWLLKHGAFSNYFITWQLWNKKQRRNSPCIYLWKEVLVHVGCSSSSQIKFLNFSSHYCSAHKLFHFWSINLKSSGHGSSPVFITRLSLSLMNRALQKTKSQTLAATKCSRVERTMFFTFTNEPSPRIQTKSNCK